MAKKVERKITVAEARKALGVPVEWVAKAGVALGLELETRKPKTLTKAEIEELDEWLIANMPDRWYVAYRAEDGARAIIVKGFDSQAEAMADYANLKRFPGQASPPYVAISQERAERVAPAMLG
jgi:hypothetical protein